MSDLDKLLIGKEIETDTNRDSKKIERFLTNKKINIIKTRIKRHLELIFLSFSLIMIVLSLSTYYLLYHYAENEKKENNLYELSKENPKKGEKVQNIEKESLNEALINDSEKYEAQFERVNVDIKEKEDLIKSCNKDLDCVVSLALEKKDPSLCLFLEEKRIDCIEKYRREINKDLFYPDEDPFYYELAQDLLDNRISLEELENYNITIEELIYKTANTELCKFTKENLSICFQ